MTITKTDLEQHSSRQSCWVVIHGAVYDVTTFLDEHPGGAAVLLRNAGKDATDEFEAVHSPETLSELPQSALQGRITEEMVLKQQNTPRIQHEKDKPPLSTLINLHDFEALAKQHLPPNAWAYYSSGADDELSKRGNSTAYQKLSLRGRILRRIPSANPSTSILGCDVSLPVYMSAVGIAKLAHPDAECALAKVAGEEGIAQVLANGSSMSVERVAGVHNQRLFFQLYVNRDIHKSVDAVKRAIRAGVRGFFVTVDSPVVGKREADERLNLAVVAQDNNAQGAGVAKTMASSISPETDWSILAWLRSMTDLPIVIKGIQCVEDAVLAYNHGVQGIVLSNHGGRSQDTAQSPLLTLLEIRRFAPHLIASKMQIFVDGGIRRGTDVLKAVALGATAVGLGRPVLYSLGAGYGADGVRRMLAVLRQEIEANMVFLGAARLSELRPEMVNASRLERDMIGSVKLIGSFYAFILNRSERVRLTVVARSNYDAVKANGITIDSANHGKHTFHPHRVVRTPAEVSAVDYIVCAHKAIDQDKVAASLAPAIDQNRTTIVIIQNGVGNEEAFRKEFPQTCILTCVTWVGATQISSGIVKHTKAEDMQIGVFPNPHLNPSTEQSRLATFAALLKHGHTRFQILDDMQPQRWEKVVWNAAWNSLTTLTMVDTQTWLHSSADAEPFTRRVMLEVISIARGCGVPLKDELVDELMRKINAVPGIGSSMQTDCKSGRPMEIDVILGFPVRRARELGIQAPCLETLYVVLRAVDGRIRAAL
ncbi:FMN-dependent dehydrogenase-domain-containing protein [Aspergillus unguis]